MLGGGRGGGGWSAEIGLPGRGDERLLRRGSARRGGKEEEVSQGSLEDIR